MTTSALGNLLFTGIRSLTEMPRGLWVDGSDRSTCDRVRAMKAGESVFSPPWLEVLHRDPCVYCGARSWHEDGSEGPPITMDHIEPVRDGAKVACYMKGRPPWHNAAPACSACNSGKSALSLLAFVAAGGLTSARSRIRKKPPSIVTKGACGDGARVAGLMRDGTLVFVWHPRRWFPDRPR